MTKADLAPPSGYRSSEFTVTALIGLVVQPLLAYALARGGAPLAGYFSMAGSALCAVAYTIARMNVKTAWIAKATEIAEIVGGDLETAAAAPPVVSTQVVETKAGV